VKKRKITSKEQLRSIIEESPVDADLNYLDVSEVTNFYKLFSNTEFNGDISQWDVSKANITSRMFYRSKFNGDISQWNLSNVRNMNLDVF